MGNFLSNTGTIWYKVNSVYASDMRYLCGFYLLSLTGIWFEKC